MACQIPYLLPYPSQESKQNDKIIPKCGTKLCTFLVLYLFFPSLGTKKGILLLKLCKNLRFSCVPIFSHSLMYLFCTFFKPKMTQFTSDVPFMNLEYLSFFFFDLHYAYYIELLRSQTVMPSKQ